jgi:hypothetical protein
LSIAIGVVDRDGGGELHSYIVVRAESEDNLRVHVPGAYSTIQQVSHRPVGGRQRMRRRQYLRRISSCVVSPDERGLPGTGTHHAGIDKGVFEFLIAAEQLSLQEGRVLDISEQRYVYGVL